METMKDYGCFILITGIAIIGVMLFLAEQAKKRKRESEALMSAILDKLTAFETKVDAAIVRVEEDVQALRDEIQRLLDEAANRDLTPEEQAKLDELQAKVDALDPVVAATLKPGQSKRKKKS